MNITINGLVPLVITATVTPTGTYHEGGPVATVPVKEHYVLLSVLPEHLRLQVVNAINVLSSGV